MDVVTEILQFSKAPEGCVMTLGVFDGLHRGHRAIMAKARDAADAGGHEFLVMSFSPGPREFFTGTDEGFYLLTTDEFISELENLGVDRLLLIPFDRVLRETRAGDFLDGIIRDRLDARKLVVGEDFAFGVGREGSIEFVRHRTKDIGLELIVVDELVVENLPVRSTTIREMIRGGRIEQANKLLGYEFHVSGQVTKGSGIGKSIDSPTANITWPGSKVKPRRGVYAVIAEVNGNNFPAVANFGVRPTFEDINPEERFEIHIIDSDPGDLTGKTIETKFLAFIRDEKKFPSVEELSVRIAQDIQEANEIIQSNIANERR